MKTETKEQMEISPLFSWAQLNYALYLKDIVLTIKKRLNVNKISTLYFDDRIELSFFIKKLNNINEILVFFNTNEQFQFKIEPCKASMHAKIIIKDI